MVRMSIEVSFSGFHPPELRFPNFRNTGFLIAGQRGHGRRNTQGWWFKSSQTGKIIKWHLKFFIMC